MLNVSFKGYTNIISAEKVQVDGMITSYLAMKLDDEGENDLTKLRELREMQGYPPNLRNDDILTLTHVQYNNSEDIFLSEKQMCWGEQLRTIKEDLVPDYVPKSYYDKIEAAHLKAYTLLANLTKRMSFDKFENEDINIKRVIETVNLNLLQLHSRHHRLFNMKEAFELTSVGCLKYFKFQPLAAKFNRKITETMTAFFR